MISTERSLQKRKTGPRAKTEGEWRAVALERIRQYAERNQLVQLDDWYEKASLGDIHTAMGRGVMNCFPNGAISVVQLLFPNEELFPWKFRMSPMGLWKSTYNRVRYIKWLAKEFNIHAPEDWYGIKRKDLLDRSGAGLLQSFSLVELLSEAYPDNNFDFRRMDVIANGLGKDKRYQRWFIEEAMKAAGNSVDRESLINLDTNTLKAFHRGKSATVLRQYETLPDCLIELFPEFGLQKLDFLRKGRGFWESIENCRMSVIEMGKKIGFAAPSDWYAVRYEDFKTFGLYRVLEQFGHSPAKVVTTLFPEWNLEEHLFSRVRLQSQVRIFGLLRALLGIAEKPLWNERRVHGLSFSNTKRGVEFDIYYPNLKLAIEVQGAQHYESIDAWGGEKALQEIQLRDQEKRKLAVTSGIRLVEFDLREWDGGVKSFLQIAHRLNLTEAYDPKVFFNNVQELGIIDHSILILDSQENFGLREVPSSNTRENDFTEVDILKWADEYFHREGEWPKRDSKNFVSTEHPLITWKLINSRLVSGLVEGTDAPSIAELLRTKRGVGHHLAKPQLSIEQILLWTDAFYLENKRWPNHKDGIIKGTGNETWGAVRKALMKGGRGLNVHGMSLAKLLKEYRGVEPILVGKNFDRAAPLK